MIGLRAKQLLIRIEWRNVRGQKRGKRTSFYSRQRLAHFNNNPS